LPAVEDGAFTVSLLDILPNTGKLIEQIAETLCPLSATFREQYDQNRCAASRLPFTKESRVSPKLIQPSAYNGTAREIVDTFLKGTPLAALASVRLPFGIPEAQRGEHWHLLGGSGHGKTQTLSHIIMSDEIVEGDILQLFNYIFASLAAELSTQMGTAFAYVSRLMLLCSLPQRFTYSWIFLKKT